MRVLDARYLGKANATAILVDTNNELPMHGNILVDGHPERVLTPSHLPKNKVVFVKGDHSKAKELSIEGLAAT